jgi:protein TonB
MPLIGIEPLDAVKRFVLLPPVAIAAEPPKPKPEPPAVASKGAPRYTRLTELIHPVYTISHVAPLTLTDAPAVINSSAFIGTGDPNAAFATIGFQALAVAKPTVAAPAKPPQKPVLLTSKVSLSQLIFGPRPSYPKLALIARVEGTVRLQAIISRTGQIENLHVLSGPALLVNAAMDGVRDWRYRPLLLNGEPVEVITEIDVTFTLRQ